MKILITGARGMLGTDLASHLQTNHTCAALGRNEFDVTDRDGTLRVVRDVKPDIIIHTASYNAVDDCEANPARAFGVNAEGSRNIAEAAADLGIPIISFSTDYVFDGEKGAPYIETDTPNPLSVYGRSKLAGENYVRAATDKHFIVRVQWLFGVNGKNFVTTIIKAARERGSLTVVDDQWGCPTYTRDLCGAVSDLTERGGYGTYHISNSGVVTWYGFTREILRQAGINADIAPCTTDGYPRPAKRPRFSPLDNAKFAVVGCTPLRPYEEALSDYLSHI